MPTNKNKNSVNAKKANNLTNLTNFKKKKIIKNEW